MYREFSGSVVEKTFAYKDVGSGRYLRESIAPMED